MFQTISTTMTDAPLTWATSGGEGPNTRKDLSGQFSTRQHLVSQDPHQDGRDFRWGPSMVSTVVKPTTRRAGGKRGLYDLTGALTPKEYKRWAGGQRSTESIPPDAPQPIGVQDRSSEASPLVTDLQGENQQIGNSYQACQYSNVNGRHPDALFSAGADFGGSAGSTSVVTDLPTFAAMGSDADTRVSPPLDSELIRAPL